MRRNFYFNLDDPLHQRAFEIYSKKKNKADFVCRALISYEENTYERLEERIRRLEERLDGAPQHERKAADTSDKRIDSIFEMHELFKADREK